MVKHSQALDYWDSIWNGRIPFPIKETADNAGMGTVIRIPLVQIYLYFRRLDNAENKKEITKSRAEIAKYWLSIYPFIPQDRKNHIVSYSKLTEYFLQEVNYTPIDIKTVRPLWESYK